MQCPFCAEHVTRVEISSAAGVRAFSLCCGASLEMIDNYDVYEALPFPLQQAALQKERERLDAIATKEHELAAACKAQSEHWKGKRYAYSR